MNNNFESISETKDKRKYLFEVFPEAKSSFDFEKNTGIDFMRLKPGSHAQVYWLCPKCGYSWQTSVKTRVNAKFRCPCCDSGKIIREGVNDVLTLVPELKEFYDFEKNADIDIGREGVWSRTRIAWQCKECGRTWESSICSRIKIVDGRYVAIRCPHYNTVKRKKHEVALVAEIPELMKFWDFEKNSLDPNLIRANSTDRVNWRCKNCEYEWVTTVVNQISGTGQCACCELKKIPRKGYSDVFTVIPALKYTYDFEKNKNVDIYRLGIRSSVRLWWKCPDCRNEWRCSLASRVRGRAGEYTIGSCHKCYLNKLQKTVLESSNANKIMKFWDYDKNEGVDPGSIFAYSEEVLNWKCKKCGYMWKGPVKSHKGLKGKCPFCELGSAVWKGVNDVVTLVPDILDIYDHEENTDIDLYSLRPGSGKRVFWKCAKCGHHWQSTIRNRVKKGEDGVYRLIDCPECSNRKQRKQTYAEQYPELIGMFDQQLSGRPLSSFNSVDARNIKCWWRCPVCENSFEALVLSMVSALNYSTKGCPYCSGTLPMPGKSFADLHPEIMAEYDPTNTVDPYKTTLSSRKSVRWICRNNSAHKWQSDFRSRHYGKNPCPICYGSQIVKDVNSIADIYPEIVDLWAPNNDKKANEVFYNNTHSFKWVCSQCRGEYLARIKDVLNGNDACPYCHDRRVLPGYNSLQTRFPEIAALWSPGNEVTADGVLPNARTIVRWMCAECHGEYEARVAEMVSREALCPYCSGQRVLPGFNSLRVKCPDVAALWSPNNTTSSDEILPTARTTVSWVCAECHGEYEARVAEMVSGEAVCPYCNDQRILPGFNSLRARHPDIAARWSPNNATSSDEILPGARMTARWVCADCHGEYEARVAEMVSGEAVCPYCSDQRILPGFNSLRARYPDIAAQWSPNNATPSDEILPSVRMTARWVCGDCHGEYEARIAEKVLGEAECPYCSNRRVLPGFNSLQARFPNIALMWSPNNATSSDEILPTARTTARWVCGDCHGEYEARVAEIVSGEAVCPYCSGKRVLPGFNSFAAKHPNLMEEWAWLPNYLLADADRIGDTSNIPVWWNCPNGKEHIYVMSPKRRLMYQKRHRESCPYCKGRRRKKRHFV